jgi:hypothetical protein
MNESLAIREENITSHIYFLRGHNVILDFDLASLYGVETRSLKQAVRRNIRRFPEDFMFELTEFLYPLHYNYPWSLISNP